MNDTTVAAPHVAAGAAAPAAIRARPLRAFLAVAVFEFVVTARSRWVTFAAAGFAAAAVAVSYFGLAAAGYAGFQGFERTAISLLSLAISFVPLLGLVLGLGAFAFREGSDLAFVLPGERAVVVWGKLTGLAASAAAATLVGLGAAGLAIAAYAGADGVGGYLWLVAGCVMLAAVFVTLGGLAGLLVRDQLQASGLAVATWIWLVILYELVLLGVLFLVPESSVRPLLVIGLFGSPVSLVRVLTLLAIGAEPVLGPGGALLLRWFGLPGTLLLLSGGLLAWILLPGVAASRAARRRE